jgi:hypothetical protein
MKRILIPAVSLSMLFVTACLCSPGYWLAPRSTATPLPTISENFNTPTSETIPTNTTEATPIPEGTSSSSGGPWLLLRSMNTVYIADQGGSNLHPLLTDTASDELVSQLVQPGGNLLAAVFQHGDKFSLDLVQIPDGKRTEIAKLGQYRSADGPGSPGFDAVRAFTEHPAAVWSPDGQKLAFIAQEGDYARLYVYSLSDGQTARADDIASQAFDPGWAPDGKHIIFFTADTFGTGAGYLMTGIWLLDTESMNVFSLQEYQNGGSGGEELLGWADDSTAILASWGMECGPNSIRRVNITNGKVQMLRKDCYVDAAVSDQGGILYGTGERVYQILPDEVKGRPLMEGVTNSIDWSKRDYIYRIHFQEASMVTVDRIGKDKQTSPSTGAEDVSMYGAIWAWTSFNGEQPGVWTSGMGLDTQQIYTDPAYSPIWDKNNNLYFISNDQLWYASFPNYQDAAPVADMPDTILDHAWVGWDY